MGLSGPAMSRRELDDVHIADRITSGLPRSAFRDGACAERKAVVTPLAIFYGQKYMAGLKQKRNRDIQTRRRDTQTHTDTHSDTDTPTRGHADTQT